MKLHTRGKIEDKVIDPDFFPCPDGESKPCLGIKPDRLVQQGKIHYCACTEEVIVLQIPLKRDRNADCPEGLSIDLLFRINRRR